MSGPTLHLPFFSSAESACLEQVHEGSLANFSSIHEFFIFVCDDHRTAFKMFHERQKHFKYQEARWQLRDEYSGIIRELTFHSPIKGAPIGPDTTSVTELHHFSVSGGVGVMEVRTVANDIPYGDHFNVVSRWILQEIPEQGVRFTFFAGAHFVKSTIWRSKIEAGSKKAAADGFVTWLDTLGQYTPDRLSAVKPSSAVLAIFSDRIIDNPAHPPESTDFSASNDETNRVLDLENMDGVKFSEDTTPARVEDSAGNTKEAEIETVNEPQTVGEASMPVPEWAEQSMGHARTGANGEQVSYGRRDSSEEKETAKNDLFVGSKKLRAKLARIMPWRQMNKKQAVGVAEGASDVTAPLGPFSDADYALVQADDLDETQPMKDPSQPEIQAESSTADTSRPAEASDASAPSAPVRVVEEPELYECVFYRQTLGFSLKFFNDQPVVISVDDVDNDDEVVAESALSQALKSRPAPPQVEQAPLPSAPVDNQPSATEPAAPAEVVPAIQRVTDPVKVAVQCDEVFGEGVKRIWKALPPLSTEPGALALSAFAESLRGQFGISNDFNLVINYLDADLGEFVQLEPSAWCEFMGAEKKVITVALRRIEIVVATVEPPPPEPLPEMVGDSSPAKGLSAKLSSKLSETLRKYSRKGSNEDSQEIIEESELPITENEPEAAESSLTDVREGIALSDTGCEIERRGPEVGSVILSINGVRVMGLDQQQVVALLTHQSRPLVVEFRAKASDNAIVSAREKRTAARTHIQYATFEGKYEHKLNNATRKTVDRFFVDYLKTDWLRATQENNGTPGTSLISVYRWIEHEMTRVGLFDNSTIHGGGIPEMGEEQWDDIREHIERFMMKACMTHSLASFPGGVAEDHAMTEKLASLRFIRPLHLGLEIPIASVERYLGGPQWGLAMTELCKAFLQSTPTDILRRLKLAVRMIAHAVEALMSAVKADNQRAKDEVNPQEAVTDDGNSSRRSKSAPVRIKQKIRRKSAAVVGCDDLLPVLTWVVIQANPPHLCQKLWYVSEFRHPEINSLGEEAYCLAQVVSATEFLKNLDPATLAITPREYELGIARSRLTQQLINTPKAGTLAACKQLIADGADVNGLTSDQKDCPISMTIKYRQPDMLKFFLTQPGVNVNIKLSPCSGNPRMVTPLMLASMSGDLAAVLTLLKAGADRYAVDSEGNTAASIAMQANHLAVVRMLLADPENITLSEACSSGNMNLIDGLLSQGVPVNDRHENGTCTPLIAAAYMGHVAVVDKFLQDKTTDVNYPNEQGETPLMFSAQPSSAVPADTKVEIALKLLAHGADRYASDIHGRTALQWAERWGQKRLVNILKYDPAKLQLFECSKDRDFDAVDALIEQGVDVNVACPTRQFTPLIAAVFNADLAIIDRLLKCPGIAIDIQGRQGMTALHYASQLGNVEVVGRLLAAGANRAIQDDRRMLARDVAERKQFTDVFNMLRYDPKQVSICLAAMHGDWLVISSLLQQGVSVNTRQKHHSGRGWHHERYTPLIAAIAYNKVDCVKKLLEHPQIDVNLPNLLGQTPLIYAASKGSERLVLMLLRKGANRYIQDRDNRSCLAWAMKGNHTQVAQILHADPARISVQESIREGRKDEVIALFKQRVDINHRLNLSDDTVQRVALDGETPLIAAARFHQNDILTVLFKSPDLLIDLADASGKTPLMHAAIAGNEKGVLMLLAKGANRRQIDYDRKTAADRAADINHADIVAILRTDPERTCIHEVCTDGEVIVLSALLKQGVSINTHDLRQGTKGETPLIVASAHIRQDMVEFLLHQPDIEIDATDADGRTALMVAAGIGALDITAALLKHGANRNLKDRSGRTADNWAGKFGSMNLARFLGQQIYY